jgi:phage terminase large subunit-like protein
MPTATTPAPPTDPLLIAAQLLSPAETDSAWRREARPEQLPPPGDWFIHLILAGRGWGKTWTGAHWLAEQAMTTRGDYAVIGRSEPDTRKTCLEGGSGLLEALGLRRDSREYRRGTGEIRLANGSVIHAYSAESPESTRGPNLSGVWCDELAAWRFLAQTWDESLVPSVRIGDSRIVVTTTPRPVPLLREFVARDDGSVVITRGSTFDNAEHLSPRALAEYRRRYEGTRIGRQELEGELLDDVEGALWTREMIEPYRVASIDRGELQRVVIGVDPAVTAHKRSNETGIVVAAVDGDGQGYVLDDLTCRLPPDGWARRVANTCAKWNADRIVAEQSHGFALVESVMRTVDSSLPITFVNAHLGKSARAEPISALYEQGKIHHVGALPELEDQLCGWVPGQAGSPDRLDAVVWAFTELQPGRTMVAAPVFSRKPSPYSGALTGAGRAGR